MKRLSLDEVKKYELDILKDVASFCEKHNLKYFLAYGTLIGAIRHQGFIPWDDDIDIQMPREDYDKFLDLYNKEKETQHYMAINPYDKMAKHSNVKVIDTHTVKKEKGFSYNEKECLGVDIDIFPIDGMPDDEEEYLKFYNKKKRIFSSFYCAVSSYKSAPFKTKIKNAPRFLFSKLGGKNRYLDMIKEIDSKYSYSDSKYLGSTATLYNGITNRIPAKHYSDYILVDFENNKFRAPVGYNEILTKIYGDYMKLPPEEKRVTHHENNVYLKD